MTNLRYVCARLLYLGGSHRGTLENVPVRCLVDLRPPHVLSVSLDPTLPAAQAAVRVESPYVLSVNVNPTLPAAQAAVRVDLHHVSGWGTLENAPPLRSVATPCGKRDTKFHPSRHTGGSPGGI